jgi:hypothetical protein
MTMVIKKPQDEVFFHTLDEQGDIYWQGIVVRELPLDHLEVQLYSWITGAPTDIKILDGKKYQWIFYTSEAKWLAAGDATQYKRKRD